VALGQPFHSNQNRAPCGDGVGCINIKNNIIYIINILIFIIITSINSQNNIICVINILIFIIIQSITFKNSIIGVTNIIILL